jgi:superfamily II DNA helicase RecQ
MLEIHGIGQSKLDRYGQTFLDVLDRHRSEADDGLQLASGMR